MLFAQTQWDSKETRRPFCTRIEYEVHVGVCVNWTLRDAVLSIYKIAARTHAVRCCFVNLENGRMRACRAVCIAPVRPLVVMVRVPSWYLSVCTPRGLIPRPGSLGLVCLMVVFRYLTPWVSLIWVFLPHPKLNKFQAYMYICIYTCRPNMNILESVAGMIHWLLQECAKGWRKCQKSLIAVFLFKKYFKNYKKNILIYCAYHHEVPIRCKRKSTIIAQSKQRCL